MNHQFLKYVCLFMVLISGLVHGQNTHLPSTNEEIVIYQVNVRAFSQNGNINGVLNRLDHIKDLGANVIYLMPLFKSSQSPYASSDFTEIDPEYGTVGDLANLIALAHQKGMAVIMDFAPNHTGTDHVWLDDPVYGYWWYQQSHNTGAQGFHGPPPAHPGWTDVYQLDFDNADLRDSLINTMKYWVNTVDCDGFRFDYADGPDVMLNDGDSDPANFQFQFWKQVISELRSMSKDLLLFAEGDGNEYFDLDFDLIYGNALFYEFKNWVFNTSVTGSVAASLNYANGFDFGATNGQLPVRFTANHDTHAHYGTPSQLFGGDAGQMGAFVVAAYMQGVPMIFSGQEVNTPNQVPFYTKGVNGTIDWSGIDGAIHNEFKSILGIRKASHAIKYGVLSDFSNNDVCGFTKVHNNEEVLVVANLKSNSTVFDLPVAAQGSWTEAFTNEASQLGSSISLDAYSYKVYRRGQFVTGFTNGQVTDIEIYPSPVHDKMIITQIEKVDFKTLRVYNQKGTVVIEIPFSGIQYDVSKLTAGVYTLELVDDHGRSRQKFVKD